MNKGRRFLQKTWNKIEKLLDEIIAGAFIALILSAFSSGWYFLQGYLKKINSPTFILIILSLITFVLVLFLILRIWKRRGRWASRPLNLRDIYPDERIGRLFVGREKQLETLQKILFAPKLSEHIVWVHGMGGMGKSWLLDKFAILCIEARIPVGKVVFDDENLAISVLEHLADQLAEQAVLFDEFYHKLEDYKHIQANLPRPSVAYGNLVSKLVTNAIGESGNLTASTIAKSVGSEPVEQALYALKSTIDNDPDLIKQPDFVLTKSFIVDLKRASSNKRIVILIDAYEKVDEEIDRWLRNLALDIMKNDIMIVVAGRNQAPMKRWHNLLHQVLSIELDEIGEQEAADLLRKYQDEYFGKTILTHGEMENIIMSCQGLPFALSAEIYKRKLQFKSNELGNDLVQHIVGEAKDEQQREINDICAILRAFDQDILEAMIGTLNNGWEVYSNLKNRPYVRQKPNGTLSFHDIVRDGLVNDLYVRAPKRWAEYHQKAAQYYLGCVHELEKHNQKFSLDWQNATQEILYHKFQAADQDALELLRIAFEEAQLNYPNSRWAILSLAYSSERFTSHHKKWLKYYETRLKYDEARVGKSLGEQGDDHDDLSGDALQSEIMPSGLEDKTRLARNASIKVIEAYEAMLGDPAMDLYVRTSQGIALFHLGRVKHAVDVLEANRLFIDTRQNDEMSESECLVGMTSTRSLATYYRIIGNYSGTIQVLLGTTEPRMQVELARAYHFLGKYQEAERLYTNSLRKFHSQPYPDRYAAFSERYLSHTLIQEKRFSEARAAIRRSRAIGTSIQDKFLEKLADCNLSIMDRDIGMLRALVDDLYCNETSRFERISIISRYANELAYLLLEQNAITEARHYFAINLQLAHQSSYTTGVIRGLRGICECLYSNGKSALIETRSARIEKLCQLAEDWHQLALFRLLQGKVAASQAEREINPVAKLHQVEVSYQLFTIALMTALRFNRFILDNLLAQLISFCNSSPFMQNSNLLERVLEFWKTGAYDGVSLIELEERNRTYELGGGDKQVSVIDQLAMACEKNAEDI